MEARKTKKRMRNTKVRNAQTRNTEARGMMARNAQTRNHTEMPHVETANAEMRTLCALVERWRNGAPLWTAFLFTAAFTFAAHGFLFSNEFFSHDAISYYGYKEWGMPFYTSVGRFLIPFCEFCKGAVASPWLIGLLFTLWTALAARVVIRLLSIRTRAGQILVCGLLCTNLAVTLTGATYIYCMDEYALALFLSAAAAEFFRRDGWEALKGLIPLILSLCLYQPYFTVSLSLCLLWVIRQAARGRRWNRLFRTGARCLCLLAAGFCLYYLLWLAVCGVVGVDQRRAWDTLNGLAEIFPRMARTYGQYFTFLLRPSGVLGILLPTVHVLLLFLLFWRLALVWNAMRGRAGNRRFLLLCICMLPPVFCSASVLIPEDAHELTTFAREFLYLLAVIALESFLQADKAVGDSAVQADKAAGEQVDRPAGDSAVQADRPAGNSNRQADKPAGDSDGQKNQSGETLPGGIWNGAKNLFGRIWNRAKSLFHGIWSGAKNLSGRIWNGTKNLFSRIFQIADRRLNGRLSRIGDLCGERMRPVVRKAAAVWRRAAPFAKRAGTVIKRAAYFVKQAALAVKRAACAVKRAALAVVLWGKTALIALCQRADLVMRRAACAIRRTAPFAFHWGYMALIGLLCLVLWHHIVFANQAYMKKDLEKSATIVLATRMIDRIESVEGYLPGQTPVTFVGRLDYNAELDQPQILFEDFSGYSGLWHGYAATYNVGRYLKNYLHYPLFWDQISQYAALEEVQAMPSFPALDCAKMIDGEVVLKLS